MEEVPIYFPTLRDEATVRYRLHLDHGDSDDPSTPTLLCYVTRSPQEDPNEEADPPTRERLGLAAAAAAAADTTGSAAAAAPNPSYPGAASVSRLGSTTTNHLLTTVLLDGEPSVVSVAVLLGGGGSHDAGDVAAFELDVAPCAPHYQATAKIHAEFQVEEPGSSIQLFMVDREGMVLRVLCRWDETTRPAILEPVSATFHNWRLHVPSSVPDHVTPHPLNRARVGFLASSGRILMALNPFLVVLDVSKNRDKVTVWSKEETKVDMESRNTWSRRLSVFARSAPEPGSVVDMAAVSALAVARTPTPSNHGRRSDNAAEAAAAAVVCTLHCDGTVHVWTVHGAKATPRTVAEVDVRSLPPASEWSDEDPDDRCVPLLEARIYPRGRLVACAVYVPTRARQGGRGGAGGGGVSVLHGSLDDVANPSRGRAADGPSFEEVSLDAVENAASLISMEFDSKNQDKCSLLTWFHQSQDLGDDKDYPRGTVCATYPPSHTSVLCSQPVVLSGWEGMLDRRAWKERSRIQALQPLRSIYGSESLEQALYEVDRQFLQYMFRPASSALTPPRAPSARCVRSALRGVAAHARLGASVLDRSGAGEPVEVEVLSFMHLWRERENRRRGFLSRPAVAARAPHDPMDTDHEMEKQEEISNEVDLQAARWKTLLLAIWTEEQSLRAPLLVSACTGSQADAAITVRPGAVSVVVPPGHGPRSQPVTPTPLEEALDTASSDAVSFLTNDKDLLALLVEAESGLSELVTSGDLVVKKDVTDPRFLRLDAVAQQLHHPKSPLRQSSETIAALMSTVSEDEVVATLEDVSMESTLLYPLEELHDTSRRIGHHSLLATGLAVTRRLESLHDQLLGRALVISALCPTRARVVDASKRIYLRSIALRWVLSQMVTMPRTSGPPAFHDRRPKVRTLDAVLQYEFGTAAIGFVDSPSRSSLLQTLSTKVVAACFPKPATSSGSTIELPETGIIRSVAPRHSRWHLVLLSPSLVICPVKEEPIVFEKRKMEVALSLISNCASEEEARAHEMVTRAFDLLSVEIDSMESTLIRVEEMRDHILKTNHPLVSSMFLSFLQNIIASMEMKRAPAEAVDEISSLSFNLAVTQQKWERAFQACVGFSYVHRRKSTLKELVLAMVANGALEDLQSLCQPACSRQGVLDGQHCSVVYEAAVEALEESNLDRRYKEALFVLHVACGDWERAAEALDSEYWKKLDELRALSSAKPVDEASARKKRQDIISDLTYLTLAIKCAIGSLPEGAKYLISARHSSPPPGGADLDAQHAAADELDQYFSLNDLALRSALLSGVATLLSSGASPRIADDFLLDGSNPTREAVEDLGEVLLSRGYYDQALMLASLFSSNEFFKDNVFHECLNRLLCDYLVPLSLGELTESSPSLEQLADSLDALVTRHSTDLPPLLAARRSTKLADTHSHCKSTYAMALLQGLTTMCASATLPVALEVARTFLNLGYGVPAWLDSLLLWGNPSRQGTEPGLFARRRVHKQGNSDAEGIGYLGDPATLLHCYIESGRYLDACRVVTSVLDDQYHRRRFAAPNRLPEKGDVDYLPYDKIDRLWNLVEAAAKIDSGRDPVRAKLLREAQGSMERALEDHFRLQKVSEEGLLSARAVRMQE